jgi:hypothetical protein
MIPWDNVIRPADLVEVAEVQGLGRCRVLAGMMSAKDFPRSELPMLSHAEFHMLTLYIL